MLAELREALGGDRAVTEVLGVSRRTLNSWRYGQADASTAATRAVWLTWILLLHPERLTSVYDLVCWGRWEPLPSRPPKRKRSFALIAEELFEHGSGI